MFDRTEPEVADLSDIIAIAVLMTRHAGDLPALEADLEGLPAARRLDLNQARLTSVIKDGASEVSALSEALGA